MATEKETKVRELIDDFTIEEKMKFVSDLLMDMESHKKKDTTPEIDLERVVVNLLRELGIPAKIKGYHYLKRAILIVVEEPDILDGFVTKKLYPKIAEEFGSTDCGVNKAIGTAIKTVWNRADYKVVKRYFGGTANLNGKKPKNSEFIALLADEIRVEYKL